jgi:hypothetical protein
MNDTTRELKGQISRENQLRSREKIGGPTPAVALLDAGLRQPPRRRKAKWTKNERGSGDLTKMKTIRLKRSSGGRTSRWASPEKGQPTPVAHRRFGKAIGADAVQNQGKSTATSRLSCILEEEQTHGTKNQLRQASDPAKRNNNGLKTNCQAHYFH